MCDHDDSKQFTYLPLFDDVGEVYICECGALIDIANPKNFKEMTYPMTAGELNESLRDLINRRLENLLHDVEANFNAHKAKRQI